ncbi:hypothetical protein KPH14_005025 [Odynerus spinipes]|uniref:RRM domain-containing protein n=1 Tax=Odynerus spinipes TaxID=1348599 RepID=A0AAD9RP52_9HYME|nr:hypothetical protein KPH14_005025 [Odynerus spinipes]
MRQELWKEKLRERAERTLHIRYPHKIRNAGEITDLFTGDFTIKLPRQPSKNCHVEFSTIEDALKNQKALKGTIVDGKPIVIRRAYVNTLSGKEVKKKGKKVKIPDVQPDIKLTQSLFIGNLKCGSKPNEIKEVLPGCISVTLLKPHSNSLRSAIVRMESMEIAAEYLLKKRPWPSLHGNRLIIKPDSRTKHKKKIPLKIDDTETESKQQEETT